MGKGQEDSKTETKTQEEENKERSLRKVRVDVYASVLKWWRGRRSIALIALNRQADEAEL